MVGLVWIDHLILTPAQLLGLTAAMWVMLSRRPPWCGVLVMLAAFWNTPLSKDSTLLFHSARYLQQFTWRQFLSEFSFQNYTKLQPPFYSFFVSRVPVLWVHQVIFAAWWALCGALVGALYGDRARFLLSTPVFLLMGTQPSNDGLLFGLLLIVLRLHQLGHTHLAALVYGLAYPTKPLALLTVLFMAARLRVSMIGSVAVWGLYIRWSLNHFFGVRQWEFLLHQLYLR